MLRCVCSVRSFQSLQKSMQIFRMCKKSGMLWLLGSAVLLNAHAIEVAQKCARLIEIGCLFFWIGLFLLLIFSSLYLSLSEFVPMDSQFLFYIWQWFTVFGAEFLIRHRLKPIHTHTYTE